MILPYDLNKISRSNWEDGTADTWANGVETQGETSSLLEPMCDNS